MNRKNVLLLVFIFAIAFILRVYHLPSGALTFGYDQSRDAFIVKEIINGDIKILGPPSSTPGLFHGVFYYYFLVPAYIFGAGNPIIAAYWTALFNTFALFVIFALVKILTDSKRAAFLAALIYAFSFDSVQYATWLSNPTLGAWTVPVVYLGLWVWISDNKLKIKQVAPFITGLFLGLSIQAEIFLAYHLIPVIIWLWITKKQLNVRMMLQFLFGLTLAVSTMIAVELKFGFKSIEGIKNLLTSGDDVVRGRSLGDFVVLYLNQIGKNFSHSLLPSNLGYGGVLGVVMTISLYIDWRKAKKTKQVSWQPFLITYILAHLPIVTLGGLNSPFLMVGIGAASVALAGVVLSQLSRTKPALAYIVLFMILLSNVVTNFTSGNKGQVIFSIQEEMTLKHELDALDYIYTSANGQPFAINTLTSPLWVNTTWSYLFNWYGVNKYGYLPEWKGRDQVGQLGNNLPSIESAHNLYFIKEPTRGIPGYYLESEEGFEDSRSKIIEIMKFGEIEVQKRALI